MSKLDTELLALEDHLRTKHPELAARSDEYAELIAATRLALTEPTPPKAYVQTGDYVESVVLHGRDVELHLTVSATFDDPGPHDAALQTQIDRLIDAFQHALRAQAELLRAAAD